MCWKDRCGNCRALPRAPRSRGQQGHPTLRQSSLVGPTLSAPQLGGQHGAFTTDGLTTAERSPPRKLARRRGPSHNSDRVCPGDLGHNTADLAAGATRARQEHNRKPRSVSREDLSRSLVRRLRRFLSLSRSMRKHASIFPFAPTAFPRRSTLPFVPSACRACLGVSQGGYLRATCHSAPTHSYAFVLPALLTQP